MSKWDGMPDAKLAGRKPKFTDDKHVVDTTKPVWGDDPYSDLTPWQRRALDFSNTVLKEQWAVEAARKGYTYGTILNTDTGDNVNTPVFDKVELVHTEEDEPIKVRRTLTNAQRDALIAQSEEGEREILTDYQADSI